MSRQSMVRTWTRPRICVNFRVDGCAHADHPGQSIELLPVSTNPNNGCNRQMESVRGGRYCFASGVTRELARLSTSTTMHLLWTRRHHNRVVATSWPRSILSEMMRKSSRSRGGLYIADIAGPYEE